MLSVPARFEFKPRAVIDATLVDAMLEMTKAAARQIKEEFPLYAGGAAHKANVLMTHYRNFVRDRRVRDQVLTDIRRRGFTRLWADENYIYIETSDVVFEHVVRTETIGTPKAPKTLSYVRKIGVGPYVICVPRSREMSRHHFYRVRAPLEGNRHPHHKAYGSALSPTDMYTDTCWGSTSGLIQSTLTDLRWNDYFQAIEIYARSYNPYSVLRNARERFIQNEYRTNAGGGCYPWEMSDVTTEMYTDENRTVE